jgi:hypothetical protein
MKATCRMLAEINPCHSAEAEKKPWSRFMPLLFLLGMLPTIAQSGFAQAPLNFGNNFFVTGDYIVAGAYGMTANFTTINGASYAVGTINVPDMNPGIKGAASVPPGAQVVAALLYWQTVEKSGVAPGAPGSGQNGFFRPLLYSGTDGPQAPGYAISGTNVSGSSSVPWSAGGCGGSGGKVLRTYRADVGGALPVDVNGNTIANTSFEVRLPSVGNSTPLTLGATLVIIYRIPSGAGGPSIPLNSIVIYDGDYAQSNAQQTMTQQLQGFYDAAQSPVSRLTHIVGSGQSNKLQTVYLSSGTNPLIGLPTLYNNLPPFPGYYGSWDNPTWTFTNASTTNPGVLENDSYVTTKVVPSASNQGCVSWGAVIVSTAVKNSDSDGILDSWKTDQGYCDASVNNGTCTKGDSSWVDLTGAHSRQKDIFLQYDYLCSKILAAPTPGNSSPANTGDNSCSTTAGDYSFDPRLAVDPADGKTAVEKVVNAFDNHKGSTEPFVLHAVVGNAILENDANVTCTDSAQTGLVCPFPKELGTIGFMEGLAYIKNQNINRNTGVLCTPGASGCGSVPVFQHGKKDSYHYALFSHGVGLASWSWSDGSLSNVLQAGATAKQSGNTVTFTTSSPHGIKQISGDFCTSGRVTVISAISNPNLNGTYCVQNVTSTTFQITVGGSQTNFTYTFKTDPNLAVVNGQVTSMSGFSDVGGQNSVISLGYGGWGPPSNPTSDGNTWQVKAGTFMHELGHTLGLTHGGTFYKSYDPGQPDPAKNDFTPSFEVNCKPNVQSSMSYLFQVDLLQTNLFDSLGKPLMVVDYSEEALTKLTESLPQAAGFLSNTAYANTSWYQFTSFAGGSPAGTHCDGTPLSANDPSMSYVTDLVQNFFWSASNPVTGSDLNFNGSSTDVMHGHDEWDGTPSDIGPAPGVDLQQVSALGTISTVGVGGAGVSRPGGGGGVSRPGGGGGVSRPGGGGGVSRPGGGGGLTTDITHQQANSYVRPPRNLTIVQEETSPRYIDLSWFAPTFGQVVQYNVYRSPAGGAFTLLASVPGSQTSYQDKTDSCILEGYHYRVTTVVNSDSGQPLESVPSNTVPAPGEPLLTGCYVITNLSAPATATPNSTVPITWTLTDDLYATAGVAWARAASGNPVTNKAANSLFAIGPLPGQCKKVGRTTLLLNGVAQPGMGTFNSVGDQFTFTWNTSAFCMGFYTFELDLDSQQKQSTSQLQLK